MPTKKPVVSVIMDDDTYEAVENIRYEQRIPSRSQALNKIIEKGLEELQKRNNQ